MKLLLVQEKMIYWSYPGRIALSWLQSPVYLMGDKNNEMRGSVCNWSETTKVSFTVYSAGEPDERIKVLQMK